MLLHIEGRLAYLAMTKCGSTSVENALRPRCNIVYSGDHRITHMPAHHFERFVRPYLEASGLSGIETACQLRRPEDWLASWWRYLADPRRNPQAGTGGMSFEAFAEAFVDRAREGYHGIWRPQAFLCDEAGRLLVDHVFRFEEMDLFARFLGARTGAEVEIPHHNRSPEREARLPRRTRARLEAFFAPEMEIWENRAARGIDPVSVREA